MTDKKYKTKVVKKDSSQLQNDKDKHPHANTHTMALAKKKPIAYQRKEHGLTIIEKQIHKGWITKIKFYPDLNYIISSSLDGFIHIHDIEDLSYKENKTFNLH